MIEDNTPTVTARRRKPTHNLRIRLETARRLQSLNARTKAKRQAQKASRQGPAGTGTGTGTTGNASAYMTAPRIPKIKKNQLSCPPPPEAKYRKRQRCKTWLPTHMFHAKRAHMTPPTQPLWRFAVPVSPTEKSYRPSHRARGARGALAWDMSYMSTVLIEGCEHGIEAVLRGLGVEGDEVWGRKGRKWREGSRVLQTWVFELEGGHEPRRRRPIAPVTLIQQVRGGDDATGTQKPDRRKIFIRVHPSAFFQLWQGLLDLAKRQNPPVTVEDLRFDIGSIEITGPGSTEALNAVLQPYSLSPIGSAPEIQIASDGPEAIWGSLLGITNPSTLPQGALLAFAISDPRLRFPCKTLWPRSDETHRQEDQAKLLASWPPDRTQGPAQLFDRSARLAASRQLPSQKAINRRRTLAGPGSLPDCQPSDPQIPILVFASRPATTTASTTASTNLTGSWTVLLPWKCVLPVWYSLLYYPLSSGGNPRFGGLQEHQQAAFEAGTPWFPGDFPGTAAGWEWGQRERKSAWHEWARRPKGRRVEFNRLHLPKQQQPQQQQEFDSAVGPKGNDNGDGGEFGRGWACDWEQLLQGVRDEDTTQAEGDQLGPKPSPEFIPAHLPPEIYQLRPEDAVLLRSSSSSSDEKDNLHGALATVRISLLGRGTPTPRARIYRLPDEPGLRAQWMRNTADPNCSGSGSGSGSCDNDGNNNNSEQTSLTSRWAGLESGTLLLDASNTNHHNDGKSPPPAPLLLPGDDAVIGFVTSGGYNLATGQGTAIGSIALSRLASSKSKSQPATDLCIVRRAGEQVGRLGRWSFV